jgi:hypothetical protein
MASGDPVTSTLTAPQRQFPRCDIAAIRFKIFPESETRGRAIQATHRTGTLRGHPGDTN